MTMLEHAQRLRGSEARKARTLRGSHDENWCCIAGLKAHRHGVLTLETADFEVGRDYQLYAQQAGYAGVQQRQPANAIAASNQAIAKLDDDQDCFQDACAKVKPSVNPRAIVACIKIKAVGAGVNLLFRGIARKFARISCCQMILYQHLCDQDHLKWDEHRMQSFVCIFL